MKKLFGILAIAVLAVCFAGCAKNTPEGVVESYIKATKSGDFKKAMSYTTLSEEEQKQAVALYETFIDEDMKKEMAAMKYEMGETKIAEDGESATVKYKVIMGEDEHEETKELVKVDGKWKIKEQGMHK